MNRRGFIGQMLSGLAAGWAVKPNLAAAAKPQANWGISRLNFREAWYVQVLHRYNEAIALDYAIPLQCERTQ